MNKIQICNIALQRIGVTRKIESLTEETVEAENCELFFDMAVQMVYEDGQFDNMLKYKALSLIAENPNDEWLYVYDYPNDAITIRHVVMPYPPQERHHYYHHDENFLHQLEVEYARGRYNDRDVIFANMEDAVVAYLEKPNENAAFNSKFASLVAWYLAKELGTALGVDFQRSDRAAQYYQKELRVAMASIQNEKEHREPIPAFIAARGGY